MSKNRAINVKDPDVIRGQIEAVDFLFRVLIATVCSDEKQAIKFADKLIEVSGGIPPETGIGSGSVIDVVLDGIDRLPSRQNVADGFARMLRRASLGTIRSSAEGAKTAREHLEMMAEFLEKGEPAPPKSFPDGWPLTKPENNPPEV